MYPQERDLIAGVFDRLGSATAQPKDPEAETLIQERARTLPDATYHLVQAVCLQDVALRQAQVRIAELERQIAARPAAASGFLGGAQGNPWTSGSVPAVPPQPMAQTAQPNYPQTHTTPMAAMPQQASPWGMSQGGGFLRGVAGTALGVAGGALLAQGISSLFSGSHAGFAGGMGAGGLANAANPVTENVTVNNYYGDQQDQGNATSDTSGWQDTSDDSDLDSGDFGSDDGSSSDF